MRTRLSRSQRRGAILDQARQIITARGYAATEMEDIRLACGISRGGLYHHFGNKRAVLEALVDAEIAQLATETYQADEIPLVAVLAHGSQHLGNDPGILSALSNLDEKQDYLASLDRAMTTHLHAPLGACIQTLVGDGVNAAHVTELFLTITMHVNRREILGDWTKAQASDFAATALQALMPFLRDADALDPVITALKTGGNP